MKVTEVFRAREYGTDRPCEIGRIEVDDCVILTFRYIGTRDHDESEWFPTWVGPIDESIHISKWVRFRLPDEMLEALAKAPVKDATS